jgi:hypothetical protein
VDGAGIFGSWLRFLWGLIRSAINLSLNADGVWDLMAGIVILAIVATIVVIPLLIVSLFWLGARVVRMVTSAKTSQL